MKGTLYVIFSESLWIYNIFVDSLHGVQAHALLSYTTAVSPEGPRFLGQLGWTPGLSIMRDSSLEAGLHQDLNCRITFICSICRHVSSSTCTLLYLTPVTDGYQSTEKHSGKAYFFSSDNWIPTEYHFFSGNLHLKQNNEKLAEVGFQIYQ